MKGKAMTQEITLRLPDKNAPGFLRRVREVRALTDAADGMAAMWEALAGYVIERGYVEVPVGVDPHEAIGDLSLADMQRIVGVLLGTLTEAEKTPADVTVDPQNGA